MSIDAEAQVAIILLAYGPCVVIVNLLGQVCTLGIAPRIKETLPDFREWCRITRHSRVFRELTGCQQTPGFVASQVGFRRSSTAILKINLKTVFTNHDFKENLKMYLPF